MKVKFSDLDWTIQLPLILMYLSCGVYLLLTIVGLVRWFS